MSQPSRPISPGAVTFAASSASGTGASIPNGAKASPSVSLARSARSTSRNAPSGGSRRSEAMTRFTNTADQTQRGSQWVTTALTTVLGY